MDSHDAVNRRWLDYELDVGKLIDFPVMTDVREPLTVAFLRAKRTADGLRPGAPEDITTAARLAEYREAVTQLRAGVRRRRAGSPADQGQQLHRTGTGSPRHGPEAAADRLGRRRDTGGAANGVQACAAGTGRTDCAAGRHPGRAGGEDRRHDRRRRRRPTSTRADGSGRGSTRLAGACAGRRRFALPPFPRTL